ncbi:MAG: NAD-dependent epimerase/dehydratase family protein [Bdellovibrionales bacterium]|nr:NAD-dependent epimerase/dehydratase family protein [Bdellovibrionales bacterium]
MKALVTGGSGFIGSTLIDALTKRGITVDVLMRKTSSDKNLRGLQYHRVEGDISDFASLKKAVEGADVIFHLAGVIAAKNRSEYFLFNAMGTENLARAAAEANAEGKAKVARFVYVSTLAAGGPSPGTNPRTERDPDGPVSAYGQSKKAGEDGLLKYRSSFLPLMLRAPIVYGPKDSATLILIKSAAKRLVPKLPARSADGEKHYSVVHASDLVEALVTLGTADAKKFENGDVFYVSSGEDITSSQLIASMAESLGVRTFSVPIPRPVLHAISTLGSWYGRVSGKSTVINRDKLNELLPDYWTCSNSKLMTKTDWRPRVRLEEGMREAIGWYKKNGWIG